MGLFDRLFNRKKKRKVRYKLRHVDLNAFLTNHLEVMYFVNLEDLEAAIYNHNFWKLAIFASMNKWYTIKYKALLKAWGLGLERQQAEGYSIISENVSVRYLFFEEKAPDPRLFPRCYKNPQIAYDDDELEYYAYMENVKQRVDTDYYDLVEFEHIADIIYPAEEEVVFDVPISTLHIPAPILRRILTPKYFVLLLATGGKGVRPAKLFLHPSRALYYLSRYDVPQAVITDIKDILSNWREIFIDGLEKRLYHQYITKKRQLEKENKKAVDTLISLEEHEVISRLLDKGYITNFDVMKAQDILKKWIQKWEDEQVFL